MGQGYQIKAHNLISWTIEGTYIDPCDYFIDGVGIIGEVVIKNGGSIVGKWPTEGYEHTESKAELEKGTFLGLAIDEDNQFDQTDERVSAWVEQIKKEFPIEA